MGLTERREREKEKRRHQILDAAKELLLKNGYNSISMRQIATLAELGVGTIYSYFKSKEEIYAVLSEEVFNLLYETISNASVNQSNPIKKIREIGESLLAFSYNHPMYYDFLDYFISTPQVIFPSELKEQVDYHGNRILEPISDVIREGSKAGLFKPVNPGRYSLIFMASIHGCIHFKKLEETILRNEDFHKLFSETLDCFIAGIKEK